jgi:hypothetical protein
VKLRIAQFRYWINTYFTFSIGGTVLYSTIDQWFDSPIDDRDLYDAEASIINLNCVTGLKLSSPTWKNIRATTDLDFQFEPIPFNLVSIEKISNYVVYSNRFVPFCT